MLVSALPSEASPARRSPLALDHFPSWNIKGLLVLQGHESWSFLQRINLRSTFTPRFHPPAVKTRGRPHSILNTNWFPYLRGTLVLSLFPRDTSLYPAVLFEHPLFSCRAAGYRLYSRLACCLACPSDIWTPAWFTSSLQTLRYSERHADKHTCPRVTVDLPGLNHNLAQGRVMMWLVPHTGFWRSFTLISQCQWRLFCFDVLGKGCPISTASLVLSLPRCLRLQERVLLCCSGTLKNSTKDWTMPAAPDDLIKG